METTTKELYQSKSKEANNEKYGEFGSECICCGKPMAKGPQKFVHMNECWVAIDPKIDTEECLAKTGFHSQGIFPIGSDCAKKMVGFTFDHQLDESHPKYKQK